MQLKQIVVVTRQLQIDGKGLTGQLFRIQHNAHIVQHRLRVHALRGGARTDAAGLRIRARAVAQLEGRNQIGVSPRAGFRLIAQLFQRVGAKIARIHVGGIGKYQGVGNLRHPLILALFIIGARHFQHLGRIAQVFH